MIKILKEDIENHYDIWKSNILNAIMETYLSDGWQEVRRQWRDGLDDDAVSALEDKGFTDEQIDDLFDFVDTTIQSPLNLVKACRDIGFLNHMGTNTLIKLVNRARHESTENDVVNLICDVFSTRINNDTSVGELRKIHSEIPEIMNYIFND